MADKKSAREVLEELAEHIEMAKDEWRIEKAITQALLELQALVPKEKTREALQ